MRFTVEAASATPPYEQLRMQVVDAVRDGRLSAGAKLPTVRALAEELGLAANTVARAYRELEADGVVEGRGRNGTFVRASGDPVEQALQAAASSYADAVTRLSVPADAAVRAVERALRAR
ncbi:GntR family transcriptional regulator [Agromyces sp. NPDC056523]|uniref:GntR family transcriptional regulator n=1 Tax=Agromyces sp. NPDC056523 TaxID=3345850 RepID=UPI003672B93C